MKATVRLVVAVVALVLAALVLWPRPIEAQLNRVSWNQIVGGIAQVTKLAIATTSTDGFTVQNTTAATSGVPVQMSPRYKYCGTAYNSTSTLSETDCLFTEVLPATVAGTTTATWKLGFTNNGSAAAYPLTVNSNGLLTTTSTIASGADVQAAQAGLIYWANRAIFTSPADGAFSVTNNAQTIGSRFKADALPTVSACGAGSPAVVAGSTPLSGAVTIGTTSVATCTITFNGTAFPAAPHCSGAVETTTAANARAMGYSASTTVLTIVPSAAWADSSVVNWTCLSSK